MPISELRVYTHEELMVEIDKAELYTTKINLAVNNLLLMQCKSMEGMEDAQKKKLMENIQEEIQDDDKVKNNKRLSRLIIYVSVLISTLTYTKQTLHMAGPMHYMMISLKLEVRNYVETKKLDASFRAAGGYVKDQDVDDAYEKGKRELRTEDIEYFEGKREEGIFDALAFMIDILCKGKKKLLNH
jgi:hypothetical protein